MEESCQRAPGFSVGPADGQDIKLHNVPVFVAVAHNTDSHEIDTIPAACNADADTTIPAVPTCMLTVHERYLRTWRNIDGATWQQQTDFLP